MAERIVFRADLMHMASAVDEAIAELTLPAMPYALRDAMERARLDDGEPMYIDLADYTDFPYLEPYLEDANDLYALNALAEKLAALEPWQMDALEGLVLMEKEKHEPFGLPRIYDLAASAGECQVLYEATSDEALGRFYVDNGFVPETENLPEALYELLDYNGEEAITCNLSVETNFLSCPIARGGMPDGVFRNVELSPFCLWVDVYEAWEQSDALSAGLPIYDVSIRFAGGDTIGATVSQFADYEYMESIGWGGMQRPNGTNQSFISINFAGFVDIAKVESVIIGGEEIPVSLDR